MSEPLRLYFTKMEGAGNDYVYVDSLGSPTSHNFDNIDLPDLSRKISDRHFGVGGDGMIAIFPSVDADFRMRMFNADGSEAQMCGNASRCIGKYLHDKHFTDSTSIRLETLAGVKILHLNLDDDGQVDSVTVDMGTAKLKRREIPAAGNPDKEMFNELVTIDNVTFAVDGVGMGNPHGVIFVDEISDRHVLHYGPRLEVADIWPEKANIEFVKILDRNNIEMRVWERGSGETLACGTGSCASVVAACRRALTDNKVDVHLLGGVLTIEYNPETGKVMMTGPAKFVADGVYYYNPSKQ